MKLLTLTPQAFRDRYGAVDTARALPYFTKAVDANVVLTLLAHFRPRRILEIGTARGQMTANLTEWSPDDALVFTLGAVDDLPADVPEAQRSETPSRHEFGAEANHFGKADKALFITADSLGYDFLRLAPLDFAFIDGGHRLAHVLSDTLKVYQALAPGGVMAWHDFDSPVPWVEVRAALERTAFPELIRHVAGTEVAFLVKQAAAPAPSQAPSAGRRRRTGVGGRGGAPPEGGAGPTPILGGDWPPGLIVDLPVPRIFNPHVPPRIGRDVVLMNTLLDCRGAITIGDEVFFGHDVQLLTGGHDYHQTGAARQRAVVSAPITIEQGAWVASRVVVLGGVTVGRHAVVGCASVVTRDVPAFELWAGAPARFVKRLGAPPPSEGQPPPA